MREARGREGGREDSCNTFSFESATNFPRATTPESTVTDVQEEEESSWMEGQWVRRR